MKDLKLDSQTEELLNQEAEEIFSDFDEQKNSEDTNDFIADKIADQTADKTTDKTTEKPEFLDTDIHFIEEAMKLARVAEDLDEVPVGALVVRDGEVIGKGYNLRETDKMATHHAEIIAIEEACKTLHGWRLPGATLYVTMEPCVMCAGAIINARIERVVFGAYDHRFGAFGSLIDLSREKLNHTPEIVGGVLEEENRTILSNYFKKKRLKAKNK